MRDFVRIPKLWYLTFSLSDGKDGRHAASIATELGSLGRYSGRYQIPEKFHSSSWAQWIMYSRYGTSSTPSQVQKRYTPRRIQHRHCVYFSFHKVLSTRLACLPAYFLPYFALFLEKSCTWRCRCRPTKPTLSCSGLSRG